MKNIKRMLALDIAVFVLVTTVFFECNVKAEWLYEERYVVIETCDLKERCGKFICDGEIRDVDSVVDLNDGIIASLRDINFVDSLQYGNVDYSNKEDIYVSDSIQINANTINLENSMVADGNIVFNSSAFNADRFTILYSRNGNITINTGVVEFNGIIYAPNGCVSIGASDVNVTGSIIANNVRLNCGEFSISSNQNNANIINCLANVRNDIIIETSYEVDEKTIFVYGDSNYDIVKTDIYVRKNVENEFVYYGSYDDDIKIENLDIENKVDVAAIFYTHFGEEKAFIGTFVNDNNQIYEKEIDYDHDGLLDGVELWLIGTNINDIDSDDDGISDYDEIIKVSSDPLKKNNVYDSDNDGVSDSVELEQGSNPLRRDTDCDGILDLDDKEIKIYNYNSEKEVDYNICEVIGKYDKVCMAYENEEYIHIVLNGISNKVKYVIKKDYTIVYDYDENGNIICEVATGDNPYWNTVNRVDTIFNSFLGGTRCYSY